MRLHLPAFAAVALAVALGAGAPADAAVRNFTVTGFDRIRIDGPFAVKLTTTVAPFARASGSPAALDAVSIEVQGRTLVVRANSSAWKSDSRQAHGPVEITVCTHELSMAWINGSGALSVDKVRGPSFEMSMQGSATAEIGGIAVDTLKLGLSGTASAVVGGKSAIVAAIVRGASALDGSALTAKNATLGAEGAALIKLRATDTAKISAQGPATVQIDGGAACTIKAGGSAEVTGCR
ncbi:MAG: DUF2807 domain-containing protein [Sphingomonas sp.]|nr:DUF2807 domain-containing protein [Sphingomonas sp.]